MTGSVKALEQVEVQRSERDGVRHDADPASLERLAQTVGVEEGHRDRPFHVELLLRTTKDLAQRDEPRSLRVTVVV